MLITSFRKRMILLVIVIAFISPTTYCTANGEALRIMPFGDSMTRGYHGNPNERGSYREFLEQMLPLYGFEFDFVGTENWGNFFGLIDADMQAIAGYTIEQMTTEFESAVSDLRPDIVLVLAGTNNLWDDSGDDFLRYHGLFDLFDRSPQFLDVFVATVPPIGCCRDNVVYWNEDFVDQKNQRIRLLNDSLRDAADRFEIVSVADLHEIIDTQNDLVAGDFVHLTKSGQEKLGQLFLNQITHVQNGIIKPQNVDYVLRNITSENQAYDIDHSGIIDERDIITFVRDVLHAELGDSNLDGRFDSSDLIEIFQAGEYEDGIQQNSEWGTGDWNGDREFSSQDFLFLLQNTETSERIYSVPEPCVPHAYSLAVFLAIIVRRRKPRADKAIFDICRGPK